MFEVTLAGTGGMMPLPDRFLTGLFVSKDGSSLLIDCGEGMQIALSKASCKLAGLDTILITHAHADHCTGLPGLLLSAGNCGKTSPMKIYCPEKASYILKNLITVCPEIPFEVEFTELSAKEETKISCEWKNTVIKSFPLRHRIPCLGYSFTEKRLPVFDPEKAKALNIPVNLWKRLHGGEDISFDGKIIKTSDVCSQNREPLKITYITDTVYFDDLIKFSENSDLLVCEGMYGDDEYIPKMKEKHHMVFSQAAKIASDSHSKKLWLTHYSPAMKNPYFYEKEIKKLFAETVISSDGQKTTIK